MKPFVSVAVLSSNIALAVPAAPQNAFVSSGNVSQAATGGEEQWGTAADIVFTASAHDFNHLVGPGTEGPTNLAIGTRTCAAGVCAWAAGARLPTGAQIRSIEVSACDGDPTQQVTFWLLQGPKVPGPPTLLIPVQGTGIAATPGCATFLGTLPTPHTVQNNVSNVALIVNSTPGTNIEWNQFRIVYRLQVSPPPASATFGDVPAGHPFFRFVEALAASGITGGCGGGNYCPDASLTRGQMAVFLATALGLHFPN